MIRVFVACQDCHRVKEVVIEGSEVRVELDHDCDGERAFVEPDRAEQQPRLAS